MSNNNTLVLDFEKNIVEIEAKIESFKTLGQRPGCRYRPGG